MMPSQKTERVHCQFCSGFETKLEPRCEQPANLFQMDQQSFSSLINAAEHEVIAHIAQELGSDPGNLNIAEQLLNKYKYSIAKLVLFEEYNQENPVSVSLALWLEAKLNPEKCDQLQDFARKFLADHTR